MIADIVSLSGYESQVSALIDEDERAAMEFFIANGSGGPSGYPWKRRLSEGPLGSVRQGKERRLQSYLLLHRKTGADLYGVDIR